MTDISASHAGGLGGFERWLSLWVLAAMIGGIGLGVIAPGLVQAVAGAEIASINLVVAVLIWAMVYPMMIGVDFGAQVFTLDVILTLAVGGVLAGLLTYLASLRWN